MEQQLLELLYEDIIPMYYNHFDVGFKFCDKNKNDLKSKKYVFQGFFLSTGMNFQNSAII